MLNVNQELYIVIHELLEPKTGTMCLYVMTINVLNVVLVTKKLHSI